MKKIALLFLVCFFSLGSVFADDTASQGEKTSDTSSSSKTTTSESVKVKVPERIPGAGCSTVKDKNNLYTCTIQPGFSTIQAMIGQIIKWFTALAALAGVLFIVINGILLSMGGDAKAKVKERIVKAITGLILLLLSGLILSVIAPWVYR